MDAVYKLSRTRVLVGITADTSKGRRSTLLAMAASTPGIVAKADLMRAAKVDVTNAELLFIHSKGSQLQGIPARPVLEPAIVADKAVIGRELGAAAKATLDGDADRATTFLKRAGIAAQRASQKWFTDPRNAWAPNAPSTVKEKGSDAPLIDTGAMRQAITYVVEEG